MFEAWAEAIEIPEIGCDDREITAAFRFRDRFEARLVAAVASFDAAELWDVDGSVSPTAWLRHHGQLTGGDAQCLATTARKLRSCPRTLEAWVAGRLNGGPTMTARPHRWGRAPDNDTHPPGNHPQAHPGPISASGTSQSSISLVRRKGRR